MKLKLKYDIENGRYTLDNGIAGFSYKEIEFKMTLSNANTYYILELIEFINPELEVENLVPLY